MSNVNSFDFSVSVDGHLSGTSMSSGYRGKDGANKFFAEARNTLLFVVGTLLSRTSNVAEKLNSCEMMKWAEVIAAGGTLPLPESLRVNGVVLPIAEAFREISLSTLSTWMCPFCASAHGTNVGPSKGPNGVSAKALSMNVFYYSPVDQHIFVISKTCYDLYVGGTSFRSRLVAPTAFRIVDGQAIVLTAEIVQAEATAKAQAEAEATAKAQAEAEATAKAQAEATAKAQAEATAKAEAQKRKR